MLSLVYSLPRSIHNNAVSAALLVASSRLPQSKLNLRCCHCLQLCSFPDYDVTEFSIQTINPSRTCSYKTSPMILLASLYVASNFSHFSRSSRTPSSSYRSSSNSDSRYSSDTSRFCTPSLEKFTSKCITAFGTWSAMVSRTMLSNC